MGTPAGWYDDGQGALRWWDGVRWTEHVHVPEVSAAHDPGPAGAPTAEVAAPTAPSFAAPADSPPVPVAAGDGHGLGSDGRPATDVPGAPGDAAAPGHPGDSGYAAGTGYPEGTGYAAGTGYPQGPGHPAGPGQPVVPAPAPASRLWILWVVLGGLALLFLVAAAVLIPLLIGLFSAASAGGSAHRDEAVAAVELYDDAWNDADCAAWDAATTSAYRGDTGYADCAAFEEQAAAFDDAFDDYETAVTDVRALDESAVEVTTTESYLAWFDENGDRLDAPQPGSDVYVYTVVPSGDGWAIDGIR